MGVRSVTTALLRFAIGVAVLSKCVDCAEGLSYNDIIQRPLILSRAYDQYEESIQDIVDDVRSFASVLDQRTLPALFRGLDFDDSAFDLLLPNVSEANVSALCLNHTKLFLDGLFHMSSNSTWALQMLDASGKPGPNLLQAWWHWLGSFTQCLNVTVLTPDPRDVTQSPPSHQPFLPKYCTARLPLAPPMDASGNPIPIPNFMQISIGVCVPDSCSGEDIDVILTAMLSKLLGLVKKTHLLSPNTTLSFEGSSCQERTLNFDTTAVASIAVMSLILAVLCLGTAYDVIVVQWLEQRRDDVMVDVLQDVKATNIQEDEERRPLLGNKQEAEKEMERGVCGRVLLAFSLYSNGARLLSTETHSGTLDAVHGVRFLSMTWVILGHVYVFGISASQNFTTVFPVLLKRWTFMALASAFFAVDSFFTLSGLLVSYLALKELGKNSGKLNWLKFYLHRYWRLTPPYMLLMLLYVPLFPYLVESPLWPQEGFEKNQCRDTWWTNLLYINNLVKSKSMCMVWSWYLANDMQFYILSPLIFVPFFYNKVYGLISATVFLLITFISSGVISAEYGLLASMVSIQQRENSSALTDFNNYYYKPYCRMGPYVVGMLAGYVLYKTECRPRLPRWAALSGWALATGSGLAVVYGVYQESNGHLNSVALDAFYNAVSRSVWGACVSWVVFACVTGHGGFVNTLLSWKALVPLSRLTYCAYLVHPIVCYVFYFGQDALYNLSDVNIIFTFLGVLAVSYGVAFLVSVAFESPMLGLERELLKKLKKRT